MADVQTENGWTLVADELLEAFARTNFTSRESRIIWAIIRKTYGFKKTWDEISYSQLTELTRIKKQNIGITIHRLVNRRILTRESLGEYKGFRIRLQKDYDQWIDALDEDKNSYQGRVLYLKLRKNSYRP